jgi:hypothetical protein
MYFLVMFCTTTARNSQTLNDPILCSHVRYYIIPSESKVLTLLNASHGCLLSHRFYPIKT